MALSELDKAYLEEKLQDAEQRLVKSDQNIKALEDQIKELEVLYKRAQRFKKHASRYNLRLQLSVLSGEFSRPSLVSFLCYLRLNQII